MIDRTAGLGRRPPLLTYEYIEPPSNTAVGEQPHLVWIEKHPTLPIGLYIKAAVDRDLTRLDFPPKPSEAVFTPSQVIEHPDHCVGVLPCIDEPLRFDVLPPSIEGTRPTAS
ncbi:MAG TPA: hypothetical protein VKQ29_11475 [Aliidongia sp.]|nr:hypothetical protein [Aliidongia sp.]